MDIPEDLGRLLAEQLGGLLCHASGRRPVVRVFGEARRHQVEHVVGDAVEVRLRVQDAEGDGLGVAGAEGWRPVAAKASSAPQA